MLKCNERHFLDCVIEAYAAMCAYAHRLPELEKTISEAYREACHGNCEFDSFNSILGPGYPHPEQWMRHVAWIAQHAFVARAYCVGNKLVLNRGGYASSPLVSQLERLGFRASKTAIQLSRVVLDRGRIPRVHAMLADPTESTVYLVHGFQLDAAMRRSTRIGRISLPLFRGSIPENSQYCVPGHIIRRLQSCVDVVQGCFRDLKVVPIVLLADDVYEGWRFVGIDVQPLMSVREVLPDQFLGGLRTVRSSEDFRTAGRDPDEIRFPPNWGARERLFTLTVDRATRALMLLNCLWHHQKQKPTQLVAVGAAALAKDVQKRYGIEYPVDLRRHDIEDCLERNGLIEHPAFEGNAFALTPKGLARTLLSNRLLLGISDLEDDEDLSRHLLGHIHRHAEKWAAYRSGSLRCA